QHAVSAQPVLLQFVEIVLVADLSEYAVHRLFHTVPFLWRFHAVHHSSEAMDWLAASRIHLVDAVVTRALAFVPLYELGFSAAPLCGAARVAVQAAVGSDGAAGSVAAL